MNHHCSMIGGEVFNFQFSVRESYPRRTRGPCSYWLPALRCRVDDEIHTLIQWLLVKDASLWSARHV
jgi:hypothetical protein